MLYTKQKEKIEQIRNKIMMADNEQECLLSISFPIETRSIAAVWSESEDHIGERAFFRDGSKNITLFGIGVCTSFRTKQKEPFQEMRRWIQQKARHEREGVHVKVPCGPIALGGFAFHPERHRDYLWKKFGNATFVIPRWLFSWNGEEVVATVNVNLRKKTNIETVLKEWDTILSLGLQKTMQKRETFQIQSAKTMNYSQWSERISMIQANIATGYVSKVVLSRTLDIELNKDITSDTFIQHFLQNEKSQYIFCMEKDDHFFVGATPERLVKVDAGNLRTMGLAGSMPRGTTFEEDEKYSTFLLNDPKNLHEHELVVQEIVSSLQQRCKYVVAKDQPEILKAKSIQHLYTPIYGRLKSDAHIIDLVKQLHPTPALGGTPREEAKEMIMELEEHDRGMYGAPFGWFDPSGNGDFIVAIRSGIGRRERLRLFAGCGVVHSSQAKAEYEETNTKFKTMLSALGQMDIIEICEKGCRYE
ncbi:MAG: isochorismate synthase [Bacilli bacterium]